MKTTIRFAEASDAPALLRFNKRFQAAGRTEALRLAPERPGVAPSSPDRFPPGRQLLIAEDGQEIRAGMVLLQNTLFVHGKERPFCWTHWPVSEGAIDPRYSMVIVQLLRKALTYQPFLVSLGADPLDTGWARIILPLGWRHGTVPFFFSPVRATRVLRGLGYLRTRRVLRLGAAAAAGCGLGLGLSGFLALRRQLAAGFAAYESREETTFGEWTDQVFANSVGDYGATVCRRAAPLNFVYPPDDPGFLKLRVRRRGSGEDIGWVVVLHKQMHRHPYFGDLRVGLVADGFGPAGKVPALLRTAVECLSARGADIIVANFSHAAWVTASHRSGFFAGPSTFTFFASPGAAPLLEAGCPLHAIHLTRGDSNGGLEHFL